MAGARGRAGSTPRRLAWDRVEVYVRSHVVRIAVVLALAFVVMLGVILVGDPGDMIAFALGCVTASMLCFIAWLVLEQSGARDAVIGSVGEDWSADALKGLSRRWVRIDSVPFEGVDVDHVLLSDAGVIAVETKFMSSAGSFRLKQALIASRGGARKIGALLRTGGHRIDVTPLLIVWGPGAQELRGDCETIDGVLVARGSDAPQLRALLDAWPQVIESERVAELIALVERRISDAKMHERARTR